MKFGNLILSQLKDLRVSKITETSIPVDERFLFVSSRVSSEGISRFPGVQSFLGDNKLFCFIGLVYADIPLPKSYEVVFNFLNPYQYIVTPIIVTFARLTIAKDVDWNELSHFMWMAVVLEFPEGIPELITNLHEADHILQDRDRSKAIYIVGVSSLDTWQARLKGHPANIPPYPP